MWSGCRPLLQDTALNLAPVCKVQAETLQRVIPRPCSSCGGYHYLPLLGPATCSWSFLATGQLGRQPSPERFAHVFMLSVIFSHTCASDIAK